MNKILVIEDEESIRDNILQLLEAQDFQALGAENGLKGVQLATEHVPDLIVCDVTMPQLDGYGVLAKLRANPVTANIPFIFLTALAERSHLRQGMELGADDYLTKPCSAAELLRAVTTRLEKHSAMRSHYTRELKQKAEELNDSIYYDCLTHLPHRLSLRERFNQLLGEWGIGNQEPNSHSPLMIPVLCLGLDQFNRINDNLGYEFGDLLLQAVAERITTRVGNLHTVVRLNGDQFAIIPTPVAQKKAAANFAQTLLETFKQSFLLQHREVFITPSIGLALYPRDSCEIDQLLQCAKKAMVRTGQQGGNNYEFYTAAFNIGAYDSLALETELRQALEHKEFQLHYQPQVCLQTGQIVGAEALIRWYHPQQGPISPAKFIPLAEETGLIVPLGDWVLKSAIEQAYAWHKAGFRSLRVAVNLSGRQFNQLNMRQRLIELLADAGLAPQYLELELTESILVENAEVAVRRLNALKAIGIRIAIDDFGTGYSSLSYLQQFPFDVLKIDQCFVRDINKNTKNAAIATAIIQMAHQLHLQVIAEGVETEAELAVLKQHQCNEMQGYLFSRPLPAAEFEKLLTSRQITTK